jgi:hypothetical protein
MASTVLVRSPIDVLARDAGLHPDLVRRLIAIGLVDANPPFAPDAAAQLARAVRLRRDLGVGYAGAALAVQLLARIDELEAQLRRSEARFRPEVRTWTPIG